MLKNRRSLRIALGNMVYNHADVADGFVTNYYQSPVLKAVLNVQDEDLKEKALSEMFTNKSLDRKDAEQALDDLTIDTINTLITELFARPFGQFNAPEQRSVAEKLVFIRLTAFRDIIKMREATSSITMIVPIMAAFDNASKAFDPEEGDPEVLVDPVTLFYDLTGVEAEYGKFTPEDLDLPERLTPVLDRNLRFKSEMSDPSDGDIHPILPRYGNLAGTEGIRLTEFAGIAGVGDLSVTPDEVEKVEAFGAEVANVMSDTPAAPAAETEVPVKKTRRRRTTKTTSTK